MQEIWGNISGLLSTLSGRGMSFEAYPNIPKWLNQHTLVHLYIYVHNHYTYTLHKVCRKAITTPTYSFVFGHFFKREREREKSPTFLRQNNTKRGVRMCTYRQTSYDTETERTGVQNTRSCLSKHNECLII